MDCFGPGRQMEGRKSRKQPVVVLILTRNLTKNHLYFKTEIKIKNIKKVAQCTPSITHHTSVLIIPQSIAQYTPSTTHHTSVSIVPHSIAQYTPSTTHHTSVPIVPHPVA